MITRRDIIRSAAAMAASPLTVGACSWAASDENYEAAVLTIWHPTQSPMGDSEMVRRELVRYATLAPSSHNTQCWKFRIEEQAISILPDLTRRRPAVDPDDHHLFVSLGGAPQKI